MVYWCLCNGACSNNNPHAFYITCTMHICNIPKIEKVKERKEGIYCLLTAKNVCCTFVIMAHSLQAAYLKLMRIVGPAFRLSYVFILYIALCIHSGLHFVCSLFPLFNLYSESLQLVYII